MQQSQREHRPEALVAVEQPYHGVSADERRAERRARLLDACLALIGSGGLGNVTMKAVCARASLTERYFYESFRDRDELLVALVDDMLDAITADVLAAVESAPPALLARARAASGVIITTLTEDPRKARLYVEAMGSATLGHRVGPAVQAYAGLFVEQMLAAAPRAGKRRRARLELAALVIVAGTAQAVTSWLEGAIRLSRDELVEEIAQLCLAAAESAGCRP